MDVSVPENSSPCYLETEARNKPQSGFQCILADNSYHQFKHLMLPHEGGDSENVHPYKEVIEDLLKNLKTEFVELFDGEVTSIDDTECVWVKTASQLEELADVLSKERVFGVDTEQHGFRSFLGFTCLIQISTTSKDYLVDAIALHDVMGILRPVFADPRICKVFHGARNDILWLQRDFHIYVVNLFDTAKASVVLWKKDPKSFAYLAEKYFDVFKNKELQRGDWRPRPLSAEQVQYARIDSHYLLPVAHRLVSELKSNSIDLVLDTIRRSNVLSLELYKKDTKEAYLGESAAASIFSRYVGRFHDNGCDTTSLSKFERIVRRLCAWREIMARVHDESLSFILSDPAIGAIAASLPTTETEIYSTICTADKSMHPSPVVCSHSEDFGRLIFLDSSTEDDDFGHTILQWHLGSNVNCPLSKYNCNLVSGTIPKLSNRPILNPCVLNPGRSSAKRKNIERCAEKVERCADKYGIVYDSDGRYLWTGSVGSLSLAKAYLRSRYNGKLVLDETSTTITLPSHDDESNERKVCIRCNKSSENELKCYQIIPNCYQEWYPVRSNHYKESKLVCVECYAIVDAAAWEAKHQIAKEFGIIVGLIEVSPSVRGRIVGSVVTLLLDGEMMPRDRVEEVTNTVNMCWGGREVRIKDMEQPAVVELRKLQSKNVWPRVFFFEDKKSSSSEFMASSSKCDQESEWLEHGKFVVSYVYAKRGRQGLFKFWQRWKQVFIDALDLP